MNNILDNIKLIVEFLAILGVVVEITPIKINPLAWIGKRFNVELAKKIDILEKRIDNIEEANLKERLESMRSEVLKFADDLRRGEKSTVERFDHIMDVMDEYHKLIHKYNIENGKFETQSAYIVETYKILARKGDFKDKIKSGDLL